MAVVTDISGLICEVGCVRRWDDSYSRETVLVDVRIIFTIVKIADT